MTRVTSTKTSGRLGFDSKGWPVAVRPQLKHPTSNANATNNAARRHNTPYVIATTLTLEEDTTNAVTYFSRSSLHLRVKAGITFCQSPTTPKCAR
jgi:hypothetical protein